MALQKKVKIALMYFCVLCVFLPGVFGVKVVFLVRDSWAW